MSSIIKKMAFNPSAKAPGTNPLATPAKAVTPVTTTPEATTTNKTFAPAHTNVSPQLTSVVTMQKTMIAVGKDIASKSLFQPPNPKYIELDNNKATVSEKFLSPILERALPKDINRQHNDQSSADRNDSKPWKIINRLTSLPDIGKKVGNQFFPDGQWGPNTTKGLINLTEILESFSNLGEKLQLGEESVSKVKVSKLRGLIPKDFSNIKDVNQKAEEVTDILRDVQVDLDKFLALIENPDWENKYLNSPLDAGYGETKRLNFSAVPGFGNHYLSGVKQDPSGNSMVPKLSLQELSSVPDFTKFITDNNITVDGQRIIGDDKIVNPNLLGKYLDYLKNGLDSNEIKLQQTPTTPLDGATTGYASPGKIQ